jgi:hypothetical protein
MTKKEKELIQQIKQKEEELKILIKEYDTFCLINDIESKWSLLFIPDNKLKAGAEYYHNYVHDNWIRIDNDKNYYFRNEICYFLDVIGLRRVIYNIAKKEGYLDYIKHFFPDD